MICEQIKNPGSAEFAKICMKWLKSNDPTLTVKNRDGDGTNVTYFRIPLNNLDYIYVAHEYLMCQNPTNITNFMTYKAVYSPANKICVFYSFDTERQSVIPKEEKAKEEALGFYEKIAATKKFNEAFKRTFPPILFAKYRDKVTDNEKDYSEEVTRTYLQMGTEVSLLELYNERLKDRGIYEEINNVYESLRSTNATEADRILIDFIAKGQTEEAVKQFIEKVLAAYEEDSSNGIAKLGRKFEVWLKDAKGIYEVLKTYCPTENEKLTRSMCQAYDSFFKGKEAPKKIKITVMGTNKKRSWRYEKNNIDIEGKIMTMKVSPVQLAFPCQAFHLYCYSSISDFTSTNLPVIKDYNRPIEIPFNDITAEDILKIEYGRNIIWERPENL